MLLGAAGGGGTVECLGYNILTTALLKVGTVHGVLEKKSPIIGGMHVY